MGQETKGNLVPASFHEAKKPGWRYSCLLIRSIFQAEHQPHDRHPSTAAPTLSVFDGGKADEMAPRCATSDGPHGEFQGTPLVTSADYFVRSVFVPTPR